MGVPVKVGLARGVYPVITSVVLPPGVTVPVKGGQTRGAYPVTTSVVAAVLVPILKLLAKI